MLKRLDDTIQSVRRLATQLRPSILDHLGLAAAIEWAAAEFAERTGVTCEVQVPDAELPASPEQVTALFRIFRAMAGKARRQTSSFVFQSVTRRDSNPSKQMASAAPLTASSPNAPASRIVRYCSSVAAIRYA